MKKNFLAGLILLLPFAVTYIIILGFIQYITSPFVELVYKYITKNAYLSHEGVLFAIFSKILVLVILVLLIILIGFLAQTFFLNFILNSLDRLTQGIPGINRIYMTIKECVNSLLVSRKPTSTKVVMVPYPNAKSQCIGFIANANIPDASDTKFQDLVPVFVPATPNPSVGFMLLYRRNQLTPLDITRDEAVKIIISCGMIYPDKTIY